MENGCEECPHVGVAVSANNILGICRKALDPALYFPKALLLIINIVEMGRKLRSRLILTETDHEEQE
jgi:hypothetical protein